MTMKIKATSNKYAAIIGMSAFCTALRKRSPIPGHWNTVSVMMANAMIEPSWRPATVITLVPVITVAGLQLGSIIAFAIITETVFQWPGMGLLFLKAVQNADIPIMAAYLLLVALIFIVINLVVDLLY